MRAVRTSQVSMSIASTMNEMEDTYQSNSGPLATCKWSVIAPQTDMSVCQNYNCIGKSLPLPTFCPKRGLFCNFWSLQISLKSFSHRNCKAHVLRIKEEVTVCTKMFSKVRQSGLGPCLGSRFETERNQTGRGRAEKSKGLRPED